MPDLTRAAAGIGALADPLRRRLYEYVCSQPGSVGRDQAADAVGIPHHQAKFHLDRLETEGLLQSEYARLTGRSGPGAGRPAKLYRRSGRDIAVSLPHREYELAGRLMADAIAESTTTGAPVIGVLERLAAQYGRTIGSAAAADDPPADATTALDVAVRLLGEYGYEPRYRRDPESRATEVQLANCPFHALAQTQTELACAMNEALITGVAEAFAPHCPHARLDPDQSRCCIVLSPADSR